MPFHLGYVSTATGQMLREDVLAILSVARRINHEKRVTGLLLFDGRSFLQVLEGDEDAARETYDRIAKDERHRDLVVLFEEQVDRYGQAKELLLKMRLNGLDPERELPTSA